DVVNLSCKNNRWKSMDVCLDKLHSEGLKTHACLGNHELMSRKKSGEANFQERFPDHQDKGYVVIQDSIATVFLNSNFSKLSDKQNKEQLEWYKNEIAKL